MSNSIYPSDEAVARGREIARAWFDGLEAGMRARSDGSPPDPCRCELRELRRRLFYGHLRGLLGILLFHSRGRLPQNEPYIR